MDDFPDPDDEYDLIHQDEYELMLQNDEDLEVPQFQAKKSKQSLNFDEPLDSSVAAPVTPIVSKPTDAENVVQKRTSRELDIDGIDVLDPPAKRQRTDENQFLFKDTQKTVNNNRHGITSTRFPNWCFVTVNTDFGERLFVKLRPPALLDDVEENWTKPKNLVSASFQTLKQRVQNQFLEKDLCLPAESVTVANEVHGNSDLWVEKFKPRKYLDLLSDEGVNRTLLNWIKMWDKVVFNKERIIKNPSKAEAVQKTFKTKQQMQEEKASELDDDGRPHHKIALLCGPPGIGKTTLAHVIAVVAGYKAIEVNASDDRSIDFFKTKLETSTQMQSVMGDRKPNCLILDEIDGAPTASIDFLIKFVAGKNVEKAKKSKKDKVTIVKRPVICICNEPYSPNLRNLRQQAYVVHFPNTSSSKLAQRLLEICRKQELKTDLSTLTLLCDKTQSDIRSCITTLHFFKNRKETTLKSSDILKTNLGLKDMQKSLFNIWQELFQRPMSKDKSFAGVNICALEEANEFEYNPRNMKRLQHIIQLLQSCGDYEKLQQGVYENMLKMRFPRFQKATMKGLEWFCWSDVLETSIRHDQNFSLLPYIPYSFAAWHFLFSTPAWPKVTYPNIGYENFLKTTKCSQILKDVMNGLNPTLRAHTHRNPLLLDVLPLLQSIITPTLRPVNVTLYNEREKAEFGHVLDVMLDFNMNYTQQRSQDGSYYYTFDPCIDEIVKFNINERGKTNEFSYNMKQLISRELELERVRRLDASYMAAHPSQVPVKSSEAKKEKPKPVPVKPVAKVIPTDTTESVQYKDFFGRVVQVERRPGQGKGNDTNNYVKSPIWFNFKEGFNNAVKKDLTIADLL